MSEGGAMARLARVVTRRPWAVILVWVIAFLACGSVSNKLTDKVDNGGYDVPGSDSEGAQDVQRDAFGASGTEAYVAVEGRGQADPRALRAAAARVRTALDREDQVAWTDAPQPGRSGQVVLVPVALTVDLGEAQQRLDELRGAAERAERPGVEVTVLGQPAILDRYSDVARDDLAESERQTFPLTLLILMIAFLSPIAAGAPVTLAAAALTVSFGALYVLASLTDLSVFVANTALTLGLGLSIDFSLFLVSRFREELRDPDVTPAAAIATTMRTTGRAIVLSGVTIAVSLVGLHAIGVGLFSSMALGATAASFVAVAAAVTLVPACLLLFGRRINMFSIRFAARAAARARLWRAIADLVVRRRVVVALLALLALVALSLPMLGVSTEVRTLSELPSDDPVRASTEQLAPAFGAGAFTPVQVLVRGDPAAAERVARGVPGVLGVTPARRGEDGWALLRVVLASPPDADAARSSVRRLRDGLEDAGVSAHVGGATAQAIDLKRRIDERTPAVVAITLLLAALLLVWGLRSIVVPLKAILTTLLTAGATLGILTVAFQELGGESDLSYFVPIFVFTIVFGLSVDYEVFLLSRIREEWLRSGDNDAAIRAGLIGSARSITLAGLVLMTVFASFATSSLASFQELGAGIAIAVLLDVTLVRTLLVPATLAVLGERNWWLPRLAVRRQAAGAEQR